VPNSASEKRVAERFVTWLSSAEGRHYAVSPGADPPDFVLQPEGWLEITEIYMRNTQAKFLNAPNESHFRFKGTLDETALRLIGKLDEKLGKKSYEHIYAERGQGFLLLTCRDFCFDEVGLAQTHKAIASFTPTNDQAFFQAAYFEYHLPGGDFTYELVYPRRA
jgi:hypothetical protein